MPIVNLVATLLAAVLLWFGCRQFRLSLAREQAYADSTGAAAHQGAAEAAYVAGTATLATTRT
ncbi:hypothetical protein [Paraburkholderia haematera]|uniref:Uncharacterized protein n=1 Tax=Paraburkholderia haematera TaxID=2793077 RepID=A0ABM8QRA7_9BURK|nr:hypothetical protein [Paraburkholderia haematera]CAE6711111.1 hypothetical protein R69888_01144 [Paraburkholderia haematera]